MPVLLAQAAQAAIAAKAAGGNTIVAFTDQMRIDNDERADVELHLRGAISHGELTLHYQPQIDLVTGSVGRRRSARSLEPPHAWSVTPVVIRRGRRTDQPVRRAGPLGSGHRLRAAFALAAGVRPRRFCLGVNVSAAQLITVDLGRGRRRDATAPFVAARNLTLEITETAVVADLGRARETLLALTALGVHLAIDDFGTGYSSFAQLKTLPVETLKIDRGFVTNLADSRDDQAIVRSIIELATSFGLETMAEGVETPDAVAALIELGCHQAQGYLIGRPKPAGELAAFLQREQARRATRSPGRASDIRRLGPGHRDLPDLAAESAHALRPRPRLGSAGVSGWPGCRPGVPPWSAAIFASRPRSCRRSSTDSAAHR